MFLSATEEQRMFLKQNNWFKKQKRYLNRLTTFHDFMLSQRLLAYALFRLSYFNIHLLLHATTHIVVVYIALQNKVATSTSLLCSCLCVLFIFERAWWGGMENMRQQIRSIVNARGDLQAVTELIEQWLSLSIYASFILGTIAATLLILAGSSELMIVISALLLMIALQLPGMVYHSGIYACSRIVRPIYSIMIPDLFFLMVMSWCHDYLTLQAILFIGLIRTCITQAILMHYVWRVYQNKHFYLPHIKLRRLSFETYRLKTACMTGLALIFSHYERLLLMMGSGFLSAGGADIFLILPLFFASIDWANLFYFDYSYHLAPDLARFKNRFEQQVRSIAILTGLLYWVLGAMVMYLLHLRPMSEYLFFLPLFVLRSILSILYIHCFVNQKYSTIIFSGLIPCIVILICAMFWPHLSWLQPVLMSVYALSIIGLIRIKTIAPPPQTPLHLYAWLQALKESCQEKALNVTVLTGTSFLNYHAIELLIANLQRLSVDSTSKIGLYRNRILWFSTMTQPIDISSISVITSGWIKTLVTVKVQAHTPLQQVVLPLIERFKEESMVFISSERALLTLFMQYFPQGIYFNPRIKHGPDAQKLPLKYRRHLLHHVMAYLRDPQSHNLLLLDYFVSVYYHQNQVSLVFLVPKKCYDDPNLKISPMAWQKNLDKLCRVNAVS